MKTVSFAITHFVVAFTVAFVLTGDLLVGGLVAMVEPMVNTVAYHFHEKIWTRLDARRRAGIVGRLRGAFTGVVWRSDQPRQA